MNTVLGMVAWAVLGGAWAAAAAAAPQPAAPGPAAPKAVITHETLWMMKRVGTPVVSPDGKWVVFPVVEPSYEPDKSVSDLWLAAVDGSSPPRQITHTKAAEDGVVWSPDSGSLAFATKREGDEAEQIYILELKAGAGDARRVTHLSTGARNPQWRPDGRAILFESLVYPGALDDAANEKLAKERKDRKYNVRTYEHFPIRHWDRWLDERQPTILVQSLEEGAAAKDILSATQFARTPGFSGDESDTGVSLAPLWSPDGRDVVFTATTERWNTAFARVAHRLYRLPAAGGAEPVVLTPATGDYAEARFSPDGRALYFKYAPQDAEVYHLPRLQRLGWPGGAAPAEVTRDFDREPAQYALSADGRFAVLAVPEAGRENLYRVALGRSGAAVPERLIEPAVGGYTALSSATKPAAAGSALVALYGSSVSPPEVVRLDVARRTHVNLTRFDTAVAAGLDWQAPQHFTFTSAKGRSIHNMLVLPPRFDPTHRYPLLVFIHGGAASNNPDQVGLRWNYHLLAAPGYVLLMTDYSGSTSFGEKFAQAIKGDPLRTPGEEIEQAVDEAVKRFAFIDGTRMCAAGASYGGHLANWIEATTTRYRCIVSHAGEVDLTTQWGISDAVYDRELTNGGPPWEGSAIWKEQSPITYAANWKTPMLLSIGEHDFRVPLGNSLEAWAVLQRRQVPSRLLVWPDAGHWISKPEDSRHFYEEVAAWLAKYLKP